MKLSALFPLACAALALPGGLAACSTGSPCDPDEVLLPAGVCLEANLLEGADAGEAPSDVGTCTRFGDPCANTDDCGCTTNTCALRTEDAEGICTSTGCVEHPSICPADWVCVDLSAYGNELPSICLPPS
jgi:hypothetical protein